jgi:hypothetical protein
MQRTDLARRPVTWFSILAIAVLMAACASSGALVGSTEAPAAVPAASDASEASEDRGQEQNLGGSVGGGGGLAAPIEPRIIKTGEMSLEVEDVAEVASRVRALVLELDGYVGGSHSGGRDDAATLTLRIPAARFDEALDRLRALDAEVIAEATNEEDVTSQVVDLGARIDNLRASEAAYRVLLERAEKIDDVLCVQSRLDEVRGQIEQLTAQLEQVSERADLSTLTVSLIPRDQPVEAQTQGWDPGGQATEAVATLVGIGQGLAGGLIWFVIVWLPALLLLGIGLVLALRGVTEVLRRLPVGPPASGGDPPTA